MNLFVKENIYGNYCLYKGAKKVFSCMNKFDMKYHIETYYKGYKVIWK